ncbi:MAG TPA: hypothetical protein VLA95_01360 [Gemmatimonadales bacterium]|nr:hypothetical protein [Gemmatimonadales bacterium]
MGGRVVRVRAADSLPVATDVVLHRVSREAQGPVDSVRSGPDGRFALRAPLDSTAVYLVSAQWAGVAYFARPVPAAEARRGAAVTVTVADSSSAQPVHVIGRHLVVGAPEEGITRQVIEVIRLRNPGPASRVAPDSLSPSFVLPLPAGAVELIAAEGDFSGRAVELRDGRLEITAPIPPGDAQMLVTYHLDAEGDAALAFTSAVDSVEVLLEEPGATAEAPWLRRSPADPAGGAELAGWTGRADAGASLVLRMPRGPARAPAWLLPVLVVLLGAGLALATGRALARRRPPA